ncbi:MAG: proline--tRNA ligase [Clostridia bacterium]
MPKKNDEFVKEIASRTENFPQWYTDVVIKTDMVDYSDVKGCMVIKPYGYSIWELIQEELNRRFKETGHKNAYFPLFIPESLLKKEAEHVKGFAPEVAWVTHGGDEELAERLCVRPTSETIICSMYSKWIQSYRDLPVLINQWANVVRWEKSTRPFLRTTEFLWQEGHTAHATFDEAQEETIRMLNVYIDFMENVLAIPVIAGQKSEKEKFAGAYATYTMEAMMQDGKALQIGTSHNLGDHFAKAYDIKYLSKEGKLEYCNTTSWGTSTRMIGGIIMAHGDDRGLVLPPKVAPTQVVILPIASHKEGVLDRAFELKKELIDAGIRVELDDRDYSAGWKFNEWEMKGVPIRLEIGPRDIETGVAVLMRRDTLEKQTAELSGITETIKALLSDVQLGLYNKALALREGKTSDVKNMDALETGVQTGFVRAMWCGERACEDEIKSKTGATSRCIPFKQENLSDTCVCCGKKAKHMMYFAKAY